MNAIRATYSDLMPRACRFCGSVEDRCRREEMAFSCWRLTKDDAAEWHEARRTRRFSISKQHTSDIVSGRRW